MKLSKEQKAFLQDLVETKVKEKYDGLLREDIKKIKPVQVTITFIPKYNRYFEWVCKESPEGDFDLIEPEYPEIFEKRKKQHKEELQKLEAKLLFWDTTKKVDEFIKELGL